MYKIYQSISSSLKLILKTFLYSYFIIHFIFYHDGDHHFQEVSAHQKFLRRSCFWKTNTTFFSEKEFIVKLRVVFHHVKFTSFLNSLMIFGLNFLRKLSSFQQNNRKKNSEFLSVFLILSCMLEITSTCY